MLWATPQQHDTEVRMTVNTLGNSVMKQMNDSLRVRVRPKMEILLRDQLRTISLV
jgi:hypothetical protein